jgi:hypothetical protein
VGNEIQTADSEAFCRGVFAHRVAEAIEKYAWRNDREDWLRPRSFAYDNGNPTKILNSRSNGEVKKPIFVEYAKDFQMVE